MGVGVPFHSRMQGSSSGHKALLQEPLPMEPAEGGLCLDVVCKADGGPEGPWKPKCCPMIVSHERSSVLDLYSSPLCGFFRAADFLKNKTVDQVLCG